MIVLDTTVLIYAVGTEHRFRDPCRELIEAIRTGKVAATTTVEVIREFAHVRARRRGRSDAAELAGDYADLLSPLLVVEAPDLRAGLRLFAAQDRLGSFDAVLAAVARGIGADALVSADEAFSTQEHPRHVIPDETGIRRLLNGEPGSS